MFLHKYIPICTVIGFLAGISYGFNALSATVGFFVGLSMDIFYKRIFIPNQEKKIAQQNFSLALVSLVAKVAKADGIISPEEIKAFKKCTSYINIDSKIISTIFNDAGFSSVGYEMHVTSLRAFFFNNPLQKINSLELLYNIAYANGVKNPKQMEIINACAFQWGLSDEQIKAIESRIEIPNTKKTFNSTKDTFFTDINKNNEYYKLLGIKNSAKLAEIKSSYKKLIRKHHPDLLRGLGKSEKEIQKGEEKIQQLNIAFDALEKEKKE